MSKLAWASFALDSASACVNWRRIAKVGRRSKGIVQAWSATCLLEQTMRVLRALGVIAVFFAMRLSTAIVVIDGTTGGIDQGHSPIERQSAFGNFVHDEQRS
ncbi:MAG: hypothetical protein ACT4PQ_04415 [Betaproteobacteria bacterium]